MADTPLRDLLAEALHDSAAPVLTRQGWDWNRLYPGKRAFWYQRADAILATLREHPEAVMEALGMEQVPMAWCVTHQRVPSNLHCCSWATCDHRPRCDIRRLQTAALDAKRETHTP
jgi:hypothetical protein